MTSYEQKMKRSIREYREILQDMENYPNVGADDPELINRGVPSRLLAESISGLEGKILDMLQAAFGENRVVEIVFITQHLSSLNTALFAGILEQPNRKLYNIETKEWLGVMTAYFDASRDDLLEIEYSLK